MEHLAGQMTNERGVEAQYSSTARLETRRGVWGPGPEGVSPVDVVRTAVLATRPRRVLEIGCGTGHLARSVLDAMPGVDYVATDASEAMVAATSALGVPARRVDATNLPFDDDRFDVVVAAWMLYHVPDLGRTLAEVRRVLLPGAVLVAATNGDRHLADLITEAGGAPLVTQFSSENAAASLRRHFDHVTQRDIETRATFPDHAAAVAYLRSFSDGLADGLPPFTGERSYVGRSSVIIAS